MAVIVNNAKKEIIRFKILISMDIKKTYIADDHDDAIKVSIA